MIETIADYIYMRKFGLTDWWSVMHFLSGMGIALVFLRIRKFNVFKKLRGARAFFLYALILLALWEVFEVFSRSYAVALSDVGWIKPFTQMESMLNIFGDLAIGLLGVSLIYKLRREVQKAPEIKKGDLFGKS